LTIAGVLIVKLNFLLFFKWLGQGIRTFTLVWWAVMLFTVASTIAQIGMQQFECFFGSSTTSLATTAPEMQSEANLNECHLLRHRGCGFGLFP